MEKTLSITGKRSYRNHYLFSSVSLQKKKRTAEKLYEISLSISTTIESSFYAELAAGFYTLNDN